MNTNEFLQKSALNSKNQDHGVIIRNRAELADGVTLSIQASRSHYCSPRINYLLWPQTPDYTHVEVGYPSVDLPEEFGGYGDGGDGIFAYVPVDLLDKFINDHGGIV